MIDQLGRETSFPARMPSGVTMKSIRLSCSAIGIIPRSRICSFKAMATCKIIRSERVSVHKRRGRTEAGLGSPSGIFIGEVVVVTLPMPQSRHVSIKCDT